jgi:hypothetical protein
VPAGTADSSGQFPIGTVNRAVAGRLAPPSAAKPRSSLHEAKKRERRLPKDLEKEGSS